ncbi:MAG: Hsp20/alpha crystallin family protein [Patescibacteria group bacterium]
MLVPWRPSFENFDDFDKMFENFGMKAPIGFSPALDVYEKGKEMIIEMPIPQINPENLEISIENDILTIQGKMEKKSEVDDKNYYRREVRQGAFYRQIPMPAHVIGEKAVANYENGILKISVPKAEDKKVKKIEVKVNKKK